MLQGRHGAVLALAMLPSFTTVEPLGKGAVRVCTWPHPCAWPHLSSQGQLSPWESGGDVTSCHPWS